VTPVEFLPAAKEDYQAALAWYEERSPRAAARFEAEVAAGIERIMNNPLMYALIDDRHRQCILSRFPYSLVYRIEPAFMLVIAVAHSRRAAYWRDRK
jgi:plasmid stabilization system protein ParE